MKTKRPKSSKKFYKIESEVERQLQADGWQPLFHDVQILGVQLDLIIRDPQGQLVLIEVKTQSSSGLARLTRRQSQRLFRICLFLAQWEPISLSLALVEGTRIRLLPVDSLTQG